MDCNPPGSSVRGQGYWSGLPFPLPGDLPNPGRVIIISSIIRLPRPEQSLMPGPPLSHLSQ